jgi:hypothetical protein
MLNIPEVGFPYAPGRRIIVAHYNWSVADLLQEARLLHNHNVLIIPRANPSNRGEHITKVLYYIVFNRTPGYMLIYPQSRIKHDQYIPTLICEKTEFDTCKAHLIEYQITLTSLKNFKITHSRGKLEPNVDHKYRQYTVHNVTGKLTEVTKMNEKIKTIFIANNVWDGGVVDDILQIYAYKDTTACVMIVHIRHPFDNLILYTGVVALTELSARKAYQTYFDIKKGKLCVPTNTDGVQTEPLWGRIARRPIDP